jgi:hypothetical protein
LIADGGGIVAAFRSQILIAAARTLAWRASHARGARKTSVFRLTLLRTFDVIDARRCRVSDEERAVFAGKLTGEQLFFC